MNRTQLLYRLISDQVNFNLFDGLKCIWVCILLFKCIKELCFVVAYEVSDLIKNNPAWIEDQAHVQSLLVRGKRPDDLPKGGFRGYFAPISGIAPLHEAVGFETLTIAGVEPVIAADDESYNKLQGTQRQQWLDLLYTMSTEPSIIGASRHLLYIGKKK